MLRGTGPVLWLAALALGVILVAAVFADTLAPSGASEQDITKRLRPPGREHVLGTDEVGRDILSRLVRGEALGVKTRDFVVAARAAGAGDARIMFRHVLPNVLTPVIVVAVFAVANMIILEATLSFLGLGVEPTVVTWGRMLNAGRL